MKQTAMQQLLAQLKHERANIPMDIEWDRCYQAIETVIVDIYVPMEKEQIMDAFNFNNIKWTPKFDDEGNISITNEIICNNSEQYYNETFKKTEQ